MSRLALPGVWKITEASLCHSAPGKVFSSLDKFTGISDGMALLQFEIVWVTADSCWLLLLSGAPYHLSPFKDSLEWGMGKDASRKFFLLNPKSLQLQLKLISSSCVLRRYKSSKSWPYLSHACSVKSPPKVYPLGFVIPVGLTLGLSLFLKSLDSWDSFKECTLCCHPEMSLLKTLPKGYKLPV